MKTTQQTEFTFETLPLVDSTVASGEGRIDSETLEPIEIKPQAGSEGGPELPVDDAKDPISGARVFSDDSQICAIVYAPAGGGLVSQTAVQIGIRDGAELSQSQAVSANQPKQRPRKGKPDSNRRKTLLAVAGALVSHGATAGVVPGRLGARSKRSAGDRLDLEPNWELGQRVRKYALARRLSLRCAGEELLGIGLDAAGANTPPPARVDLASLVTASGVQQDYVCPDGGSYANTPETPKGGDNGTN